MINFVKDIRHLKVKFRVIFLESAIEYLESLDKKTMTKVIYNIDKASYLNDPRLFKKIDHKIWEFRTKYASKQYRFLAFWAKIKGKSSLVVVTHGFVKKDNRIPKKELIKASDLRSKYIEEWEN